MLCVIVAIAASAPAAQSKTLKKYKEDFSLFFQLISLLQPLCKPVLHKLWYKCPKIFIYNG